MEIRYQSIEEVQKIAKRLLGKSFSDFIEVEEKESKISNNKGFLGQIIETKGFGIDNNNRAEPDFIDAGIELKLTPYKMNKNGTFSAKERMVLNIIDYMEEYKYNFEKSHFLFKNNRIEIIWYLYEKNKLKKDLKITHEKLFSLEEKEFEKDREIIKNDWNSIIKKIRNGKAHEISESDTMYLGACPKGANKNSLREQPFNEKKAMQRAFCYKNSYMTILVRKYIANEKIEQIIKEPIKEKSFEQYIIEKINIYFGKTEKELENLLNIESKAKNKYHIFISKMLKINGDIENSEEFLKANIKLKTIRVEKNKKIKEHMSFPTFKFDEIIKEKWEDAQWYDMFSNTKYMFMIFEKNNKDEYVFKRIKLWNMPCEILDKEVKSVWEKTRNIIKSGKIIKKIEKNKIYNNFPTAKDNKYCHIRPHAQNASDTYKLPYKDKKTGKNEFTKQCFWLNKNYIEEIIKEDEK